MEQGRSTAVITLPLSPRNYARLEAPFPMSRVEWKQMLNVLRKMRIGLVD